jgi:hypothetical protein
MRPLIALAAAAALLAGGAIVQAQGPPNKSDVTLTGPTSAVVYKTPTAFSGRIKGEKAGVSVVLQRRNSQTAPYTDLATVTTTGNGDFSFAGVEPRRNAFYRALARTTPEQTSDDLFVAVAPIVKLKAKSTTVATNERARFRGKVRPRHNRRKVQIQRQEAAGFVTVATARLRRVRGKNVSRFRKRVTIPATGVYRAFLPGHADHAEGGSNTVTISAG